MSNLGTGFGAGGAGSGAGNGREGSDAPPRTTTTAAAAPQSAADLLARLLGTSAAPTSAPLAAAAPAPRPATAAAAATTVSPSVGALSAPLSAPFETATTTAAASSAVPRQGRRLPACLAATVARQNEAENKDKASSSAAPSDAAAAFAAAFSALEAETATGRLEEQLPPPGTLTCELLKHQRVALAWCLSRESSESGGGGILADEQGLGKTVEAAALVAAAPRGAATSEDEADDDSAVPLPRGGTLVVCPTSLLHQWLAELRTKVDPRAFASRGGGRGTDRRRDRDDGDDGDGDDGGEGDEEGGSSIVKHHGPDRSGDSLALSRADVVVTTYGTCREDFWPFRREKERKAAVAAGGGEKGDKKDDDSYLGPLHSVRWSRIILDEAHHVRNRKTKDSVSVSALRSAFKQGRGRWCLTGTPLVNGVEDLYALFRFLRYEPYCNLQTFESLVSKPIAQNGGRVGGSGPQADAASAAMDRVRLALRAVTLRRTKQGLGLVSERPLELGGGGGERESSPGSGDEEVETDDDGAVAREGGGAPAKRRRPPAPKRAATTAAASQKLPPRVTTIQKVQLYPSERALYDRLSRENSAATGVGGFPPSSPASSPSNYVHMMVKLLRMRQACDHPALVRGTRQHALWKGRSGDVSSSSSLDGAPAPRATATTDAERRVASALAPRVRQSLLSTLDRADQLCASCGDVPEHPACVTPCGHLYCRGCGLAAFSSSAASSPSAAPPPSLCRACGVPVSHGGALTRAALLGKRDEDVADRPRDDEREEEAAAAGAATAAPPPSSFGSSKLDALMAIVLAVVERNREARRRAKEAARAEPEEEEEGEDDEAEGEVDEDPFDDDDDGPRKRKRKARRKRATTKKGRRSFSSLYFPEKVVVFSQWTSMLDLVCDALRRAGVASARIDGGMSPAAREAAVAAFQRDATEDDGGSEISVIAVSLKAASLGLNLTAASHVVLADPWFNRATELQAADRAHRLGQRASEVRVTRLVCEDTVEERVVALAEEKGRAAASALGGDGGMGGRGGGVSEKDLRFLFGL